VYREYKEAKATMGTHAANIIPQGQWVPLAWPHDGHKHDPKSGRAYQLMYREDYNLNMLPKHATFSDEPGDQANYGFEAGVSEMYDRMQTVRWKVFSTCVQWFAEYRGYHRLDGQVVKIRDDLLSASRIGMMMRRFAKSPQEAQTAAQALKGFSSPRVRAFGVLDETIGY
jgi:hypothetical protein